MQKKQLLTTAVLAALAQAAVAQQAPAPASQGLEEIVITAERRSQSVQTAPLAVTAVTGDDLAERGVSTAQDITKLVPAVTFAEGGGGSNQVFIRGIGGLASNGLTEQLVAFNMDGTYLSRTGAVNGLFFDLDRVEIVKGPQGTLYGRNATAGAVNVISNKPTLDHFGGNISLTGGDYSLKKVEAAINAPMSSTTGLRLAVQSVDRKGYLTDGYNDEKHWSARASLLVKPSDKFSILLTADYGHLGGRGGANVVAPLVNSSKPWAGPTTPDLASVWTTPKFVAAILPNGQPLIVRSQFQPEQNGLPIGKVNNDNTSFYGSIDWDAAGGKFTVIPAYRRAKVDAIHYAAGFPVVDNEDYTTKSLEARYASPDQSPLRGVVGLYYIVEDGQFTLLSNPVNALPPGSTTAPPLSAYTRSRVDNSNTKATAVFGQLTYDLSPTTHLIAGLRASDEKKTVAGSVFSNPFSGDINNKKTTWKTGLEFDLSPASMAYATIGTGFKAGGFFPAIVAGGFTNTFKPETITSWTVGSKNRFMDNRLQFNAEAFYWDYKDKQVSHLGPVVSDPKTNPVTTGLNLVTENAGKAKFYGLELDMRYRATATDMFAGTVQYEHSKYDSYVFTQPTAGGPALTNCKTSTAGPVITVDCSGQVAALTPTWSMTLNYSHVTPLSGGADMVFTVAGRYKSSYWLSDEQLDGELQAAATKVDLSLAYNAPGDSWSVAGFVNNATNKAVLNAAFVNTFIKAPMAGIEAPRTYGIRAAFKF